MLVKSIWDDVRYAACSEAWSLLGIYNNSRREHATVLLHARTPMPQYTCTHVYVRGQHKFELVAGPNDFDDTHGLDEYDHTHHHTYISANPNCRAAVRHVESVLPWGKELLRRREGKQLLAACSLWSLTSAVSGLNVNSTFICQVSCFSAFWAHPDTHTL